jgi:hypothetical protein
VTDLFWPPTLYPSASRIDVLDNAGRYSSGFSGFTRTIGRPGTRLRMAMTFHALKDEKKALVEAIISALGGEGRVYVHDHSNTARGATSFAELVPNPTFDSLTGFTISSVFDAVLTDRVLRLTRNRNTGVAATGVRLTDAATVTPYQPYVGRMLIIPGRGMTTGFGLRFGSSAAGSEYAVSSGQDAGLLELAFTPYASTAHFAMSHNSTNSPAGEYCEIPFVSLAPCALVDNGQNLLPTTDINNAAWSKSNCTTPSTSVALPDGSTGTTNTIHEASDTGQIHFLSETITLSGSALGSDFCFGVALKAAGRTWGQIRLRDETATHDIIQSINLSTGALGTRTVDGATWGSDRAFVVSLGDGWWGVFIVGRLLTSNTSIGVRILVGEADADVTFNGTNQDSIYVWRPTLAQSSVPMRLSATTGTALASGTEQGLGHGIYTKGWPASTAGMRKIGDLVAINGQLLKITAPVSSDAAGRAFLQFGGHLKSAPADGTPVILNTSMGKFMLENPENGWSNAPGIFSDAEIVLVEAA